ncbi:SITS-binding protein-like isoform X1 [Amblyraja radiata]|uniref:SITS-binding protein-like isoform X1 n=1 Tax=Amblyraja radiata TaxID=386614 RepID=UPI001402369B|nr:SITS-binding protein-like isoform X1 [Amblyraja radiata]
MVRRAREMASAAGDSSLDPGIKEMNETWKGAIACLGVALLFLMTIGVLYWQVVDKPHTNWVLRGQVSGLAWDRRSLSFSLMSLSQDKTFAHIDARHLPNRGVTLLNNLCWFNTTQFCYTWDGVAELQVSLDTPNQSVAECYRVEWTPLQCKVALKDCFSMVNVSWYGGGSMQFQYWPLNNANINSQPFIISDLHDTPMGYGSVLERYFLGSTGVAVRVHQEVPLHVGIESRKQLCLGIPPNAEMVPLSYTICVSDSLRSAYQQRSSVIPVAQPDTSILWLPLWRSHRVSDTALRLEHNLKMLSRKLKHYRLGEGVMDLCEQSTLLLSTEGQGTLQLQSTYRGLRQLRLSITLSPFTTIDSRHFQTTLQEGREHLWLRLPSTANGSQGPLLMKWRGRFAVKLNISDEEAQDWFIEQVRTLQRRVEVNYITLEVGVGSPYLWQAQHHSCRLCGDEYINQFALLAQKLGNATIISAATRAAHLPMFVRMVPRQSDWSYAGLKGLIPSVLHYSLLGYSFFIPDAIGGSLTNGFLADEELFIRWLQVVTFLPVMPFSTPPWVFGETWIVNVTRSYIHRHQAFVVPLLLKYAAEWASLGHPVFRPLWWISPSDPSTFIINDEFLIGDEVLVAPVTEPGKVHRDIYLPGNGYQWKDVNTAQVIDGGTLLEEYPVPLTDVAVFIRQKSQDLPFTESQPATPHA